MSDRNRDEFLWSELTPEEKKLEKEDFVQSYMLETGCDEPTAKLFWGMYLNQEGWTGRDERIMMERDRLYELKRLSQMTQDFGGYDPEFED